MDLPRAGVVKGLQGIIWSYSISLVHNLANSLENQAQNTTSEVPVLCKYSLSQDSNFSLQDKLGLHQRISIIMQMNISKTNTAKANSAKYSLESS